MYPPFFHPFSGNQQKSLAAVDFHASLEATRCHRDGCSLVGWDGGLGFRVGNGWVNCFTNNSFLSSFGWQRLHDICVLHGLDLYDISVVDAGDLHERFGGWRAWSVPRFVQTNSWTRTLEKPRHPRSNKSFACSQFVPLDFLFDFGASQTSPWNDELIDVIGGGTMFEASSQQHGHLNGWTN